jgi:tetratricopeptide (TPR) repeat protein
MRLLVIEVGALLFLLLITITLSLGSSFYAGLGFRALINAQLHSNQRTKVEYAAEIFEFALSLFPTDVRIYRGLARTYLLCDKIEEAVNLLVKAYELNPQNTLNIIDLATAYDINEQTSKADIFWLKSGFSADQMARKGDDYLRSESFESALIWYERSVKVDPNTKQKLAFRLAVVSIISKDANVVDYIAALQTLEDKEEVARPNETLEIAGGQLNWLSDFPQWGINFGDMLLSSPNLPDGTLWWNGQAVKIVRIAATEIYTVTFELVNTSPPPIEIAVGVDGRKIQSVSLSKGDNTPQPISITIELAAGFHTFHVWFLNNDIVEGQDRDAIIRRILIHHSLK